MLRGALATALAFGAVAALPPAFVPASLIVDGTAERPNVLVFLIDDMGYSDLGVFGSPNASTPHVDALVARGVKLTQWISAAPICTPSRAALQTGRYPIRTGCMGNVEKVRVIPTPSNPGGLDPAAQMSLATALKQAGYATGMSGKWHLGINHAGVDHAFTPTAHSYDSYLGSPYTNAPMCEPDADGMSNKYASSQGFCFMAANTTVVQQPLRLENFTGHITQHAVDFLARQSAAQPWYFLMSYFHVHTPLFTNRTNRGRSRGGKFGDNVEELDDSVGTIIAAVDAGGFAGNTAIFLTSDNGPYQEEGWENAGRTALWGADGKLLGRLKGGKGQLWEGGVRMPGAVVWPGVVRPGTVSDVLVSTMDIFPTALAAAGVAVGADYPVDGKDMAPALRGEGTQHDVFLHYCGFSVVAARVSGRWKVFWATPKWYTNDAMNASVCLQCCNGVNPASRLTGAIATELCGCEDKDLNWLAAPTVYDMAGDVAELAPLTAANWPAGGGASYADVVAAANATRAAMQKAVHPKPSSGGAGTCTAGLPSAARQMCCPGCKGEGIAFPKCKDGEGNACSCNTVGGARQSSACSAGVGAAGAHVAAAGAALAAAAGGDCGAGGNATACAADAAAAVAALGAASTTVASVAAACAGSGASCAATASDLVAKLAAAAAAAARAADACAPPARVLACAAGVAEGAAGVAGFATDAAALQGCAN